MADAGEWQAHVDKKGRTFYYNKATGVSAWTIPGGEAAAPAPAAAPSLEAGAAPRASSPAQSGAAAPGNAPLASGNAGAGRGDLPAAAPRGEELQYSDDDDGADGAAGSMEVEGGADAPAAAAAPGGDAPAAESGAAAAAGEGGSPGDGAPTTESRRDSCLSELRRPDAVLQDGALELFISFLKDLKGSPAEGAAALVDGFAGLPAQLVLAGKALELSRSLSRQAGDPCRWEDVACQLVADMASQKFSSEKTGGFSSAPSWVRDMIASPRWRQLLLSLYRKHSKDAVLLFCITLMCRQGLHREVARSVGVADNLNIANAAYEELFKRVPLAAASASDSLAEDAKLLASTDLPQLALGQEMLRLVCAQLRDEAQRSFAAEGDGGGGDGGESGESGDGGDGESTESGGGPGAKRKGENGAAPPRKRRRGRGQALLDAAAKLERVFLDACLSANGTGRVCWPFLSQFYGGAGDRHKLRSAQGDASARRSDEDSTPSAALRALIGCGGELRGSARGSSLEASRKGAKAAEKGDVAAEEAKAAREKLTQQDRAANRGYGRRDAARGPQVLRAFGAALGAAPAELAVLEAVLRRGRAYPDDLRKMRDAVAGAGAAEGGAFLRVMAMPHCASVLLDAAFHSRNRLAGAGGDAACEALASLASAPPASAGGAPPPAAAVAREAHLAALGAVRRITADKSLLQAPFQNIARALLDAAAPSAAACLGVHCWVASLFDHGHLGFEPAKALPPMLPQLLRLACCLADRHPRSAGLCLALCMRCLCQRRDAAHAGREENASGGPLPRPSAELTAAAAQALVHLCCAHGASAKVMDLLAAAARAGGCERLALKGFLSEMAKVARPPFGRGAAIRLADLLTAGAGAALVGKQVLLGGEKGASSASAAAFGFGGGGALRREVAEDYQRMVALFGHAEEALGGEEPGRRETLRLVREALRGRIDAA